MKVKTHSILIFLLVVSSFSYGSGITQFLLRVGMLPLCFILALVYNPRVTLLLKWKNISFYIIVATIFSVTVFGILLQFTGLKPAWKFVEYLLMLGIIAITVGEKPNSMSLVNYLEVVFRSANMVVAISVFFNFAGGGLDFSEISGSFPIINANMIGSIFGIQLVFSFFLKRYLATSVFIGLVYSSGSMGAVIAVVGALGFGAAIAFLRKVNVYNAWVTIFLIYIGAAFSIYLIVQSLSENFLRFSGRTAIWTLIYDQLGPTIRMFSGVGYGVIRDTMEGLSGVAKTLHNSYLEVLFSLGFLAFSCFIFLIFVFPVIIIKRESNKRWAVLSTCLLVFVLIKAFTSSNLVYLSFEAILFSTIVIFYIKKVPVGRLHRGRTHNQNMTVAAAVLEE